jgi:hypothetical protein
MIIIEGTHFFRDMVESDCHGSETLGAVTQAFPELAVLALQRNVDGRRTNFHLMSMLVTFFPLSR